MFLVCFFFSPRKKTHYAEASIWLVVNCAKAADDKSIKEGTQFTKCKLESNRETL